MEGMADLEAALARRMAAVPATGLAPPTIEAVRVFLMDSLAVGLAGTSRPDADTLRRAVRAWGGGEDAQCFLGGPPLPAPSAALVDAFLIHGLEYDCVHEPAVVHPMASVLAACLAAAARERSAGRPVAGPRLAAALVAGVGLAVSIGMAGRGRMRFFRPATAGVFGATAGVARLLELDEATTGAALGVALGQVPGTLQAHIEGSPLLPLQMGFAARAAVQAVDLAVAGLDGPAAWLTGPFGYLPLIEGGEIDLAPLDALVADDPPVRITELSHKPWPCGRLTHGAVEGAARLQREQGFAAGDIARIRVVAPPLVHQLVARPPGAGMDATYARLCLPWCVACRLVRGSLDVADFHPGTLADPAVLGLAERVEVAVDDRHGPAAILPQTVEVTLTGGRRLETRLDALPGSPAAPLDHAARLDKVRRAAAAARAPLAEERLARLIRMVDGLMDLDDVTALTDLAAASR